MPGLPPDYLDARPPSDVIVTDRTLPAIVAPTLGEPLGEPSPDLPAVPAVPAHQLVTVGDSLTHGMSSAAVFRTDLSWPVLVAAGLGGRPPAVPTYGGPLDGLPLNLERLLGRLQERFGDGVNPLEFLQLPLVLHQLADENEDYWERGDGADPPRTDIHYENLGIYGWDVRIIAEAVLDLLSADGVASTPIDFATIRQQDTLNSQPPPLLKTMLSLLTPFLTRFLSRP